VAFILLVIHRYNAELPQQLLLAITITSRASLLNAVSTLQSSIVEVIVCFVITIRKRYILKTNASRKSVNVLIMV